MDAYLKDQFDLQVLRLPFTVEQNILVILRDA